MEHNAIVTPVDMTVLTEFKFMAAAILNWVKQMPFLHCLTSIRQTVRECYGCILQHNYSTISD